MHSIMDPPVGTFAGSIVEPTDVPTEHILPPTEDILPPILPPTEDILPASEHFPVRFTVGIGISAKLSHFACRKGWACLTGGDPAAALSASDLTRCSRSRMAWLKMDWGGTSPLPTLSSPSID